MQALVTVMLSTQCALESTALNLPALLVGQDWTQRACYTGVAASQRRKYLVRLTNGLTQSKAIVQVFNLLVSLMIYEMQLLTSPPSTQLQPIPTPQLPGSEPSIPSFPFPLPIAHNPFYSCAPCVWVASVLLSLWCHIHHHS